MASVARFLADRFVPAILVGIALSQQSKFIIAKAI